MRRYGEEIERAPVKRGAAGGSALLITRRSLPLQPQRGGTALTMETPRRSPPAAPRLRERRSGIGLLECRRLTTRLRAVYYS